MSRISEEGGRDIQGRKKQQSPVRGGGDEAECCQGREKTDRTGRAMCAARSGSTGHVTELDVILRPVGTCDKGLGG